MEEVLGKSSLEEREVLVLNPCFRWTHCSTRQKGTNQGCGRSYRLARNRSDNFTRWRVDQFLEAVQLLESNRQHCAGEDGLWTF
jgi:hypothetical protein